MTDNSSIGDVRGKVYDATRSRLPQRKITSLCASGRLALTGTSAAAHAAVFSEALFSERVVVADGALGEMLPLNVATVAPTALESPRD